ncbi:hypothetical protein D3C76_708270 [compost metagenome]|uniref:Uncharacterized protein n=1 Tax=Pseudomonas jinjuensis TaxID=198616 RepID=A0A1H0G3J8_9PSED|nr:hypothetical protein [Pseudomonas jinjuensis]SDO01475.1 hypothetical protein SAMN05216193_10742 [Pseudomonas jinjuensis]
MKSPIIATCCTLLLMQASGSAWAFCTDHDAEVKGKQVAAKVASITQSDPERAEKLNEKLRAIDKERSSEERPDACAAYDDMLKELDQSAPKVERETQPSNDSEY